MRNTVSFGWSSHSFCVCMWVKVSVCVCNSVKMENLTIILLPWLYTLNQTINVSYINVSLEAGNKIIGSISCLRYSDDPMQHTYTFACLYFWGPSLIKCMAHIQSEVSFMLLIFLRDWQVSWFHPIPDSYDVDLAISDFFCWTGQPPACLCGVVWRKLKQKK